MQQHVQNPSRVIIYPVGRRQPVQSGGAKCPLIFFTVMFLLIGFILTMVGNFVEPFWGPENDWCDFCRAGRLRTERQLKNCRIVGPILLAIGALLLVASIFYLRAKNKNNAGEFASAPTTVQMGSTTQGVTATGTASAQYPPNPYGYQQPYGQSPAYPTGSYPNNPPPPAGYSPYPTGSAYPPPAQNPYTSPQSGQGYSPYPTEMPPPPSYESSVGQSHSSPSAPPLEKVG